MRSISPQTLQHPPHDLKQFVSVCLRDCETPCLCIHLIVVSIRVMWLQDETELLKRQKDEMEKHLTTLRSPPATAAAAALSAVAKLIADDAGRLHSEQLLSALLSAAHRLSLHYTHHFHWLGPSPKPPQQQQQQQLTPGAKGRLGQQQQQLHVPKVRHVYLSFPTVGMSPWLQQVPTPAALAGEAPIMLQQQQQQPQQRTACCALGFVLCTQFPAIQQRRRYWLLVSACNIQGLPGPVFKRIVVPGSCYLFKASQQAAAAGAVPSSSAGAGGAEAAAGGDETARTQDGPDSQAAAGGVAGAGEGVGSGARPGPISTVLELPGVVAWCHVRMTYERLLVELQALQLPYTESMQAPATAGAGASDAGEGRDSSSSRRSSSSSGKATGWHPQPVVYLLDVPGMDLYMQLVRRSRLRPSRVGLKEVWFTIGAEPGEWAMHLRGSCLEASSLRSSSGYGSKSRELQAAGRAAGQAAAVATGEVTTYLFSFQRGEDVRGAVVLLQQVLHLQRFLVKLESLALGVQALSVAGHGVLAGATPPAVAPIPSEAAGEAAAGGDEDVDDLHLVVDDANYGLAMQEKKCVPGGVAGSNAGAANALKGVLSRKRGSSTIQEEEEGQLQQHKDLTQIGSGANGSADHDMNGFFFEPAAKRVKLGERGGGQQQQQQGEDGEQQQAQQQGEDGEQQQQQQEQQQQLANGRVPDQLANGPSVLGNHHHPQQQQGLEAGGVGIAKQNGGLGLHAATQMPLAPLGGTEEANGSGPQGPVGHSGPVCDVGSSSSSSSRGGSGLLWHWAGTGLIRLVEVSATHAVLACGPPLQQQGRAWQPGVGGESSTGAPASRSTSRAMQEVRFTFSWQPACPVQDAAAGGELGAAGASAAAGAAGGAHINTTSSSSSGASQRWVEPSHLLGMKCKVTADVAVPVGVLEELGEMVDAGEEGLLLDALAVVAWPLAALSRLVLQQHLWQEGGHGAAAGGGGAARGGEVGRLQMSLAMHDSVYDLRLLLHQGQRQGDKQQAEKVAGILVQQVFVVGLCFSSHGRVGLSFLPADSQWLQLQAGAAAAAAGGADQGQHTAGPSSGSSSRTSPLSMVDFVQHLAAAAAPGVVQGCSSSNGSSGGGCIWLHVGVLPDVLEQLLQFVLSQLQQEQQGSDAVAITAGK